jgi:hypothetical protein
MTDQKVSHEPKWEYGTQGLASFLLKGVCMTEQKSVMNQNGSVAPRVKLKTVT